MVAAENHASLLAALLPEEIENLLALPWQKAAVAGEATGLVYEKTAGITNLTGALPFVETRHCRLPEEVEQTQSANLASFLLENRAACRAYLKQARAEKLTFAGAPDQARLLQVAAECHGVEAAAFAVFLATRAASAGEKVLLADADDQNQFVFSLLAFADLPPILTENLQKPSSFKNDLGRCIVKAWQNVDYLNLHATSLRPFDDTELGRICGFLDADYDTIILYSGRRQSRWLSFNADTTFSFCPTSLKGELMALERHRYSPHLILLHPGDNYYFPCLTREFRQQIPDDRWQTVPPNLRVLANYVDRLLRAKRLILGDGDLSGALNVLNGAALYVRLSGGDEHPEKTVNSLQSRLRARYPRDTFFHAKSAVRAVARCSLQPVTILLEIEGRAQLVSLVTAPELLATAIFPQGVVPGFLAGEARINAISPRMIAHFRTAALRGHFNEIYSTPRYSFKKPNALAALLQQLQP